MQFIRFNPWYLIHNTTRYTQHNTLLLRTLVMLKISSNESNEQNSFWAILLFTVENLFYLQKSTTVLYYHCGLSFSPSSFWFAPTTATSAALKIVRCFMYPDRNCWLIVPSSKVLLLSFFISKIQWCLSGSNYLK